MNTTTSNYSKKRLAPLINKYGIDVDKDFAFRTLMQMFDSQTDYQIWSLKAVKEGLATLDQIQTIYNWLTENPTEIKKLERRNIISYNKCAADIQVLLAEIKGLERLHLLNNVVNKFNTNQRQMIKDFLNLNQISGLDASTSTEIKEWYDLMRLFSKLPIHRQQKIIKTSSSFNDEVTLLKSHIAEAFKKGYVWDREDLLRFMQENTSDCQVVFDENNVVMISVPSYASAKLLCGGGRTAWCLTKNESYFKDYVLNYHNTQYFVFDFNKPESDELSHIGFTVGTKEGVIHAHSTTNQKLMEAIRYQDKYVNIFDVLNHCNISYKIYCPLAKLSRFEWNKESIKKTFSRDAGFVTMYESDDKIVLAVDSVDALSILLDYSRINFNRMTYNLRRNKVYAIFNLGVDYTDEHALSLCAYTTDEYGVETFKNGWNPYGKELVNSNFIEDDLNLITKNFLQSANIKPELLLHRAIDRRNEKEVLEYLNQSNVDVNYSYMHAIPLFKIVEKELVEAFNTILTHPCIDLSQTNASGDNILTHLMYAYVYETNETVCNMYESMIKSILKQNISVNLVDELGDTMLTLAAESKKSAWVISELLERKEINVNVVNDNNYTALTKAIRYKNVPGVKLLLKRPDTVVRQEDFEMAAHVGMDLQKLLSSKSAVAYVVPQMAI